MIENLITMNGYGLFVWSSFAITILTCALLYLKTYRTLKKYEKDFAKELSELSASQRRIVLEKSKVATQVLASYNKSI
jgi:heme exporter protein CcmD